MTALATGASGTLGLDAGAVADLAAAAVAQSGSLTERALVGAAQILGLSLIAAGVAAVVALLYRWYVRERVPGSLPALFGLSAVVPLLGTNRLLRDVMSPGAGASASAFDEATALFNIAAVLVALVATRLGTDVGDRLGSDVAVATGERAVETEVSRVVQAVGRVITVEITEEVEDIVGYDPVPAETKEKLAGKTFVFPRRLTVEELRDRLVTRLKTDYGVGHVDLELGDDGSVEYLAVGSRAAGIGPTLPPETSAVAVKADPAFAASAGDLVQVWRTDPFERVVTAELRGVVDDVATLAIDAADTRKLDAEGGYKLVTLPVETRPDREFASVLRAAEETMAAVTVGAGSALAGQPVGALDVTVVAVRPESGPVEPLPDRDRTFAPGDAVYVVAAPEAIRKIEAAASPRAATAAAGATGAALTPDEQIDPGRAVGEGSDDGEAPPNTSESSGNGTPPAESAADPLADADAPGIEALETDDSDPLANGDPAANEPTEQDDSDTDSHREGTEADDADSEVDGAPDDEPAEPTRTEPAATPGIDADEPTGTDDEPTGTDDAGDDDAVGDDWETITEPDASEDVADGVDPDGRAEEVEPDDDGDETDDSGGSDWTVAVDQRREDDE
ncbi:TrkA-C domain-containing protein [Halosimplex carlsbadense 2-9-1]|uniref:TrkA-C domain-containing protein n=1 Tax=Halosimplex carlsbadense 2-9-1 TaxID=797114 RepID=M0D1Y5_9EURY|nr:TrkA-C domain-containing protein [Halosimplex carlsbadense]ELZ28169.1 TrkA-C domain-containing protein [Halosimplex carlsbadense 2-9-1]